MCQFQTNYLALDFNETQDFDGNFHFIEWNMQNQVVQVLKPFLLFMHSFQKTKTHNMFVRDVRPSLQQFGIGHLVCWHIENITNYT